MSNLKEIRTRIGSVESTQQITRAMKMVAASKLKKAQNAILKIRPYANKLNEIIVQLFEGIDDISLNPFYKKRTPQKILLIPVTADKGLCGSYNSSIIKTTVHIIEELTSNGSAHQNIDLLCIGKKAKEYFGKNDYNIIDSYTELYGSTYVKVESIATKVLRQFKNEEYDLVKFIFNGFKNAAVYNTTIQQYLPIEQKEETENKEKSVALNYIFEPTEEQIIDELIPTSLKVSFYRIILEANASELGARMTAMDKATENAQDILKELKLTYNKARQTNITNEILEIVSGSDAI